MEVTHQELSACKQYMRIDSADDDLIIESLYKSAVLYLAKAGVTRPPEDEDVSLYNLAVWRLTLHYYEHRADDGKEISIPAGLRPIINQLQMSAVVTRSISDNY